MTGASGYVASLMLPAFRERYDMVMLDATGRNRQGEPVEGVQIADLTDADRGAYSGFFQSVDAVVHLAHIGSSGDPLDHFEYEQRNVQMAYNVLRSAYDAGVPRVVFASSNHAADWYEHRLVHRRKLEVLDPYALPLSDNFYGWAKATYEHMGFLFASGNLGIGDRTSQDDLLSDRDNSRKMGVVMVRIGHPREIDVEKYAHDPTDYKRHVGAYVSARDLTQLFVKSIETPNIDNEDGVPWLVVYGISDNTRAFWSLVNARRVLGYTPEDDSEVRFADDIYGYLVGEGATGGLGRVGLS